MRISPRGWIIFERFEPHPESYFTSHVVSLVSENIDITNLLNITFESSVTANNRLKQMSSEPVKICSCKPSNKTSNSPIINCAVSSSIKRTIQTYPGKSVSLYLAAVDALSCIDYKDNYDIYFILTYSFTNSLQQQRHSSDFQYSK